VAAITIHSLVGPLAERGSAVAANLGVFFGKKAPPHVVSERNGEDGSSQKLFSGGGQKHRKADSEPNHFILSIHLIDISS
jgi:hypothetical protein